MPRREAEAGSSGTRPGGSAATIPPGSRAPGLEASWTCSIIPVSGVKGGISGKSAACRAPVPRIRPVYLGSHST